MTKILSPLSVEYINNTNIVMLHDPFGFISDVLASHSMKGNWYPPWLKRPQQPGEFWAPKGFVFDFESIPNFIRGPVGENKRGGAAHDPISRKNAVDGITQAIAADVYLEIMSYCDSIDFERFRKDKHKLIPNFAIIPIVTFKDWSTRGVKSEIVRYWPKSTFWQKYELTATVKEVTGYDCDPYVTLDKLDVLIEQNEQVSAGLKDAKTPDVDTDAMVKQTDKITDELKEAKGNIKAG